MIDRYKHLNDTRNDGVVIGVEEVVRQIEKLNYGAHRMLSAFVRCRLARQPDDELAFAISELLKRGLY